MPQDTYYCTQIWHFTSENVKQVSNGLQEQMEEETDPIHIAFPLE